MTSVTTKAFALIAAFALLGFLAGCDQDRGNNGGQYPPGQIAVTPMSNACGQGIGYQPASWQDSRLAQYGAIPYGGQGYPVAPGPQGYCGCPQGYQPMCDSTFAMVCVPLQNLEHPSIAWWRYGNGAWGFQGYAGYNQVPYDPYYGHGRRDPYRARYYIPNNPQWPTVAPICSNHVGRVCTVGTTMCGPGSLCIEMQPGSGVGYCGN